jgi:hypothetical protein
VLLLLLLLVRQRRGRARVARAGGLLQRRVEQLQRAL